MDDELKKPGIKRREMQMGEPVSWRKNILVKSLIIK